MMAARSTATPRKVTTRKDTSEARVDFILTRAWIEMARIEMARTALVTVGWSRQITTTGTF